MNATNKTEPITAPATMDFDKDDEGKGAGEERDGEGEGKDSAAEELTPSELEVADVLGSMIVTYPD